MPLPSASLSDGGKGGGEVATPPIPPSQSSSEFIRNLGDNIFASGPNDQVDVTAEDGTGYTFTEAYAKEKGFNSETNNNTEVDTQIDSVEQSAKQLREILRLQYGMTDEEIENYIKDL